MMTKQEKARVYKKEYRRINKAKIDAYNKAYHEKNAESSNAKSKAKYIEAKETMTEAQKENQRLQRAAASRKHYAAHRDQVVRKRRSSRAAAKFVQTNG
jgi:hypothetical protein